MLSLPVCQPSTVLKYQLSEQTFSQFFPDEPPQFPFSPPPKGGGRGSCGQVRALCSSWRDDVRWMETLLSPTSDCTMCFQAGSPLLKAAEKLKLLQQKEEMAAVTQDKARVKKEKEVAQEARRRDKEDKERLREEQRRRFEEEKQRRREEKERRKLEKEKVRLCANQIKINNQYLIYRLNDWIHRSEKS